MLPKCMSKYSCDSYSRRAEERITVKSSGEIVIRPLSNALSYRADKQIPFSGSNFCWGVPSAQGMICPATNNSGILMPMIGTSLAIEFRSNRQTLRLGQRVAWYFASPAIRLNNGSRCQLKFQPTYCLPSRLHLFRCARAATAQI